MHRSKKNLRTGFTLIETIAAIVILAIAIPPMIWAVSQSHAQRVAPVQASTARWLAAERMEQVIADRHGSVGYANLMYAAEPAVAGFPGFSRDVTIAETGHDLTGPGTGYRLVTVSVRYTGTDGNEQVFSLSTVLTEFDL